MDDFPALCRTRLAPAANVMTQLPFVDARQTRQRRAGQYLIIAVQNALDIHLEDQTIGLVEHGGIFFFVLFRAIHKKVDAFAHIFNEARKITRKGDDPARQQLATAAVSFLRS